MTDDSLSDEDKALFHAHMRHVKPLKNTTSKVQTKPAPAKPIRPVKIPYVPPKKDYYLSDFISEAVLSHEVLSYAHPSLPVKRFKDLKYGRIAWESRLDLHGLHVDEAREALCQFIERQIQNHKRCVLIIHGQGGREGAPPVIKNLVNRWLPQIDEILAFHSAQAKHGGHGAVYVLLKNQRFNIDESTD
jgi:DNA-nicking Smr family endonuclease